MARRRPRHQPRDPFVIGLICLAVLLPLLYLGFTKDIPFSHGFRIAAVFIGELAARGIARPDRRRERRQGREMEPEGGADAARVVMEIDDQGLPVHVDATAKIRPRIFLEGNFFVDLRPGTPGAPVLHDGDTLRISQTAAPVQLDEVLTVAAVGHAAGPQGRAGGDRRGVEPAPDRRAGPRADPRPRPVRGRVAQRRLRRPRAGGAQRRRSSTRRCSARGRGATSPGCCAAARYRRRARPQRGAAARADRQLQHDRGRARRRAGGAACVRAGARPDAAAGEPRARALAARSRPRARGRARSFPASARRPPPSRPPGPGSARRMPCSRRRSCRASAGRLAPVSRDLARLTEESLALLPQTQAAARCARDVVLPTGDVAIQDEFATGRENYKEFFYALVGLAGEGQGFDGNGQYVRFQTGGGDNVIRLGRSTHRRPAAVRRAARAAARHAAAPHGTPPRLPAGRGLRRPAAAGPQRPRGGQGSGLDAADAGGERDEGDPQAPRRRGGDRGARRRRRSWSRR